MAKIIEALTTREGGETAILAENGNRSSSPAVPDGRTAEPILAEALSNTGDDDDSEGPRQNAAQETNDFVSVIKLNSAEDAKQSNLSLADDSASEPDEDIFFIEVGGPNRHIEGSPEVMAFSPKPRRPVAAEVEDAPATLAILTGELPQPAIQFQPWPREKETGNSKMPGPAIVVYHNPDDAASRLYCQLSEQVLESAGDKQVLLFTSVHKDLCTAATLLNLAFAAAGNSDLKVAAVDCNWNSATMTAHLGLPAAPGLQEVLAGDVALGDALLETPHANLSVLSFGEPADGGTDLWTAEALRWIVHCLCARYDLVMFHAPAIDQSQEFAALLSVSEAVYPIVPEKSGDKEQLHTTIAKITRAGAQVHGVIYDCFPIE